MLKIFMYPLDHLTLPAIKGSSSDSANSSAITPDPSYQRAVLDDKTENVDLSQGVQSQYEEHEHPIDGFKNLKKYLGEHVDCYLGDSWFGSVKTVENVAMQGAEGVFCVKTATTGFPKDLIEDLMDGWPGGSSIVLKATTPSGIPIVAVGYKYNSRTVLCFAATENAGSTLPGSLYKAKYTDKYNNVKIRKVERPAILSMYFDHSNAVDNHNKYSQSILRLEKLWTVRCGFKRIATTLISKTVVDTYLSFKHGVGSNHQLRHIPLQRFLQILVKELFDNGYTTQPSSKMADNLPLLQPAPACDSHSLCDSSSDDSSSHRTPTTHRLRKYRVRTHDAFDVDDTDDDSDKNANDKRTDHGANERANKTTNDGTSNNAIRSNDVEDAYSFDEESDSDDDDVDEIIILDDANNDTDSTGRSSINREHHKKRGQMDDNETYANTTDSLEYGVEHDLYSTEDDIPKSDGTSTDYHHHIHDGTTDEDDINEYDNEAKNYGEKRGRKTMVTPSPKRRKQMDKVPKRGKRRTYMSGNNNGDSDSTSGITSDEDSGIYRAQSKWRSIKRRRDRKKREYFRDGRKRKQTARMTCETSGKPARLIAEGKERQYNRKHFEDAMQVHRPLRSDKRKQCCFIHKTHEKCRRKTSCYCQYCQIYFCAPKKDSSRLKNICFHKHIEWCMKHHRNYNAVEIKVSAQHTTYYFESIISQDSLPCQQRRSTGESGRPPTHPTTE